MIFKKYILTLTLVTICVVYSNAQLANMEKAQLYYSSGKLDSAKAAADLAVGNIETKNNAYAWYLKGFIYKDLYKTKESTNKKSGYRAEALKACKRALELDTKNEYTAEIKKVTKYLASRFYNDAADMDGFNYKIAIENFNQYKEATKLIDPSADLKTKEIEFSIVLGDVYEHTFSSDMNINGEYFNMARDSYNKALALDPNNFDANYRMALLYYNRGVNSLKQTDYDIELTNFNAIQDNAVTLFKQSLPYLEKSYQLDPKNPNVLDGLSGVYYSLMDFDKHTKFSTERKLLEK